MPRGRGHPSADEVEKHYRINACQCKLGNNGGHPIPGRTDPIRSRRRRRSESGYALLLVFLMAAALAVAPYTELPRATFEAQRAREELLIERGEQYKRAIQIFVRKVGRYPATIEELESLSNVRFLRKRYLDPMTGKEKWRLIHINGGMLTDSVVQRSKPGQDLVPSVPAGFGHLADQWRSIRSPDCGRHGES